MKELEDRIGKDSHNSSKPPSTDGFRKPKSLRPKGTRPSGGQKGHPGRTLEFADPTTVIPHRPDVCEGCGASLEGVVPTDIERRQVFDLPPPTMTVTEHQLHVCACPACGKANRASAPDGVDQPVQYGPRIKATATYLLNVQLLPYERTAEMMDDLFGVPLSEGTLCTTIENASQALAGVVAAIANALKEAKIVHFDETGQRIAGKLHWLHVACTGRLTHYRSHPKRGKAAFDAIGILPAFAGLAVHDGLRAYYGYECAHGLCNGHHLRELIGVLEHHQQSWAGQMFQFLREIKREVDKAKEEGKERLPALRARRLEFHYRKLIKAGYKANPPPPPSGRPGRVKQGAARCLVLRLDQHQSDVLAFMHDFAVPFDNNQAERDIRMMKLKQKISGGFRSQRGADSFNRIRGYASTLRKQGINVLSALHSVFLGTPVIPDLTPE
jgi:transposase